MTDCLSAVKACPASSIFWPEEAKYDIPSMPACNVLLVSARAGVATAMADGVWTT
eukprot:CAMPEP_0169204494 /NCGR_PEP_ID=MMETSP1016-20121227/12022_1 /TAXON_ID=342587 /ORGANISM="Karlodinium micrum, Strain CCMP2283" /LENGTH=54 /DNA_ID=CAMNT_0009281593 /DNA_START=528 /DNA_END=692 /DNA_ORIENTATION=-